MIITCYQRSEMVKGGNEKKTPPKIAASYKNVMVHNCEIRHISRDHLQDLPSPLDSIFGLARPSTSVIGV